MSYEPGTLLSIGAGTALEQVVVLSDGRVATKLFAGKPVERRDILNLSDWLLLTEGQNMTVTTKDSQNAAAPEPVIYAIGTMLRWIKDDQNKRVALVLKDGLLQVKEMINGMNTRDEKRFHGVKRTFFKDFAAWKASLPEGGAITAEANATQYTSSMEDKTKPIDASLSNVQYISELIRRFNVHSTVRRNSTIADAIKNCRQSLKDSLARLNDCASKGDSCLSTFTSIARHIEWDGKNLQRHINSASGKSVEELNRVSYNYINNYRQKLFAYKGGLKFEIGVSDRGDGLLALARHPEGLMFFGGEATTGKTFAELGIEMKPDGKPRLEVSYRRRRFEL